MIRGVIFDVDGTLVNFAFDVVGTRKAIIEELKRRGYDTSDITTTSLTQVILATARRQIESGFVRDDFRNLRSKIFSMLDAYELHSAEGARPLEGTIETLGALRRSSIRLGIVTNNGRLGTSATLSRSGLLSFFEFVLTREDVPAMKPEPDGILQALRIFSLSRGEVLYVGDSVSDINAASSAGVRIVSVATGSYSLAKLVGESPDLLLGSISDLPYLIESLRGE